MGEFGNATTFISNLPGAAIYTLIQASIAEGARLFASFEICRNET